MKKVFAAMVAATMVGRVDAQVLVNSFGTYTQDFSGYTAFDAAAQPPRVSGFLRMVNRR